MTFRIRNQKDLAAGLIYIVAGAGFALGALNYKIGDAARMGPGWFPLWIGLLLVGVGVLTALSGMRPRAAQERVQRPDVRAMAWVLGAVVLHLTRFGLHVFAVGSDAEAARRSGINVRARLIGIYVLSGVLAGLAAMMSTARFGTTTIGGALPGRST